MFSSLVSDDHWLVHQKAFQSVKAFAEVSPKFKEARHYINKRANKRQCPARVPKWIIIYFLFIRGLNLNFPCFCVCLCVIISVKQKKIKPRPRVKLSLPCKQRLHFRCVSCLAESSNLLILGTLRNYDGDGNGNVTKKQ